MLNLSNRRWKGGQCHQWTDQVRIFAATSTATKTDKNRTIWVDIKVTFYETCYRIDEKRQKRVTCLNKIAIVRVSRIRILVVIIIKWTVVLILFALFIRIQCCSIKFYSFRFDERWSISSASFFVCTLFSFVQWLWIEMNCIIRISSFDKSVLHHFYDSFWFYLCYFNTYFCIIPKSCIILQRTKHQWSFSHKNTFSTVTIHFRQVCGYVFVAAS